MQPTKVSKNQRVINFIFIAVILAAALAIRLINLHQSLWLDEGIEWWAVKTFSIRQLLFGYMTGDFNPPAHHLLMWFWVRLFGDSEQALRFPSVLFGVGVVWYTYKIAELLARKEEQGNGRWPFPFPTPVVAALLLSAFSGLLVYYSQEARMYSMATFFVTASMYSVFKLQQKPSRVLFTVYCFLFTVALYTHYLPWFLLPFLTLFGVKYLAPLLLTVPWWPELLKQFQAGISTAGNPAWASLSQVSLKSIALVFVKFVTGRIPFPKTMTLLIPVLLMVAVFYILVLFGCRQVLKSKNNANNEGKLLIFWAFGPLILGALIGVFIPIFSYFRFLFILPAFILLAAFGLKKHDGFLEPITVAVLLCTVIYVSGPLYSREDWKGLVKELHSRESSPSVLIYPAVRPPFDYYDRGRSLVSDASSFYLLPFTLYPSVWYISYAEDIFGSKGGMEQTLSENKYSRTFVRHFRGVTLQRWERAISTNNNE